MPVTKRTHDHHGSHHAGVAGSARKKTSGRSGAAGKGVHKKQSKKDHPPKRWSREVMLHSDALDLDKGVFMKENPVAIARSLQRSAKEE
ncbi:DUF3175 domain-containing protein [Flavihumibacter petaseus]|uniref:DUF3175 domain-containing protein n=1 Tax=Flavihumibacter petaseus TaxID=549295 RepID=UPI0034E226E9